MKPLAAESTAKRLAALEQQFADIEKMTKGLARRLSTVAETVRIAVEELSEARASAARPAPRARSRRRA